MAEAQQVSAAEPASDWIERTYQRWQENIRQDDRALGLPWKHPRHGNTWVDYCPTCKAEVTMGWDEGYAYPDGDCFEVECDECGAEIKYSFHWWVEVSIQRGELMKEGTRPEGEGDDEAEDE